MIEYKYDYKYDYKYCPPEPFVTAVKRQRLLSEFKFNSDYSVVVIQGPAGHGKTTLMQQIYQMVQESGALVSWLTLDDSDNDISHFNSSLRTLITNAVEDSDSIDVPEEKRQGTGAIENILRLLESIDKPTAFFLDEFQVINEQVNLNLLCSVLERSPARIKFYIGTRSIPKLAQGRLLISGRLKYITSDELRFSTEEVKSFLDNAGLQVSDAEAAAFREKTEGWPAILQLFNLALKSNKVNRDNLLVWVKGCPKELRSYLAEHVMSGQNEQVQQFLLWTSPLRRLSPELCDLVTGHTGGRNTLEHLVSQGMFIRSMDVHKQWFKYHSVFSEYLRAQLMLKFKDKEMEVHRIAADWFLKNNLLEEAIYHAIQSKDYNLAADTLEKYSEELIRSARLGTLEQLCSSLPESVFESRPILYLYYIWALMFLNLHQKARQLTDKLEGLSQDELHAKGIALSTSILKCVGDIAYDHFEDSLSQIDEIPINIDAKMSKFRHFECGSFSNVKAINRIQCGKLMEAREFSIMGESLGASGEAAFSSAYSSSLLGLTMILGGELGKAVKHLSSSLRARELKIQGSLATASLSAIYGYALYESGDYPQAESHLRDSIDMISQSLPTDWQILAHIALARSSAMEENEDTDSIEILDRAEKLALTNCRPRLFRAIKHERIRMALLKGDHNNAKALNSMQGLMVREPALPDGWVHLAENADDEFIKDIRLEIHCGDAAIALKKLNAEHKRASQTGRVLRTIKILIFSSMANWALGKNDTSFRQMNEALKIAVPQHYISVFFEEGERCLNILTGFVKSTRDTLDSQLLAFIVELCPDSICTENSGAPKSHEQPVIEPLTDKERAVMALVVDGFSNKEIADQLFVSYNTIKFHMKNIFSKLAVKNRIDLVRFARNHQLG
jgi:LuxR family maltose regulon positive regulatory protein